MKLLMVCGTWIRENDRVIIDYIRKCSVFPNVNMIVAATGLPECRVKHTLSMLRQQEGMRVGRCSLFDDASGTKTRTDILIHCLMDKDIENVTEFREANRYYDKSGKIKYRFTEEEIIHSIAQYNNTEGE